MPWTHVVPLYLGPYGQNPGNVTIIVDDDDVELAEHRLEQLAAASSYEALNPKP